MINLTVILPSLNKDIISKIKSQLDKDDEFIYFRTSSANIRDDLNRIILSAKNNDILLWNPRKEKRIDLEKFRIDCNLASDTQTTNKRKINVNASIKFNRSIFSLVEEEAKNLIDYIKKMLKNMDVSVVENIDKKRKNLELPSMEPTAEEVSAEEERKKREKIERKKQKEIEKSKPRVRLSDGTIESEDNTQKYLKRKPTVLFVCDVKGWAWWIKSNYLKKYLEPYYNIDIVCLLENNKSINYSKYDLCFTYGYFFISKIKNVPIKKRITGITAHRPKNIIKPKMAMAHITHANSVLLYNELRGMHNRPFYVPNGVDPDQFYSKISLFDTGEIVFGHIGKLSPRKGQQQYIEPAIKKAKVNYFSHYNNYKSKVPHDRMVDIHQNFDVFIVASEEDGTPCPGLEAAACGRPIISNKIGNMPELIENYKTGILLDKRDVDLYVDAIKWCRKNPEKVVEMGQNIRKKIEEEWSWKLMARNYLYMFDQALGIKRLDIVYENPARHHIK